MHRFGPAHVYVEGFINKVTSPAKVNVFIFYLSVSCPGCGKIICSRSQISSDSTKMRLTDALMRKRQPCSLNPTTLRGWKKTPNPYKKHTLIGSNYCLSRARTTS